MIEAYAGTILIVTGVMTAVLAVGVVAPNRMLRFLVGIDASDPTWRLIARHWLLVGALVGGLLIYAGFHVEARVPAMAFATIEKLAFGALVITSPLRGRLFTLAAVGVDSIMVVFYLAIFASQTLTQTNP